MPYKNESMLMGGDASADTSTELCFSPPEGPFGPDNVVTGTIGAGDEDWIIIKLTEGNEYTITVTGRATVADDATTTDVNEADASMLNDSVLKLMDGKGGLIDMNDDIDGAKGKLNSELTFTPEAGSGTQVYFISVSGYTGNPGAMNVGGYTVSVKEVAVLPAGESADIEGTDMADKLTGTDDSESIAGLGGDDTIYGLGGDDSLIGGDGSDLLKGGAGADTLKGGNGEDTISYMGSPMGVTINLNAGTAMGGHADGDVLGEMIENVIGSDHDDMITGTDNVSMGNKLLGMGGNDTLSGREGPDTLDGGAGDDVLDGGDEDDTLEGGPGADELTGGMGDDTASYAGSMMGVTVRLHASQAMGGDAEGDTWGDTVTVEYDNPDPEAEDKMLEETVPDIVHLTGSAMADILAGDSRNNTIKGGGGDDKIYGGPGGGDDMLMGEGGNDMLFGGRGDDTLSGGMGDDTLNGGTGGDTFTGGAGSDMIYADRADLDATKGIHGHDVPGSTGGTDRKASDMDTLSFAKFTDAMLEEGTGITLNLQTQTTVDGPDANTDPDAVNVTNINSLIGTEETDSLTGRDGTPEAPVPETIEGGNDGDTLVGGAGPGDTVSYASSDDDVRVNLGDGEAYDAASNPDGSTARGGHAGGDTISGFENVIGSAFGDDLTALAGTAGATGSTLWGLAGDDELEGGDGNDTLEGGAGADELDGTVTRGTAVNNVSDSAPNMQVNTLSYAASDAGVQVNLEDASASGGHADGDEIKTYDYIDTMGTDDTDDDVDHEVATFRNVTGSMHNDHLTGDMFANVLAGGAGNDTLRGGDGSDRLIGGAGGDRLDGGKDEGADRTATGWSWTNGDWAVYRGAMDGVMVNMSSGMGTGGEAMDDTLKNIEVIWGSKGHSDVFIAGPGPDIFHGDGQEDENPAGDTVSFEASKHGVSVNLATDNSNAGYDHTAADSATNMPSTWTIPTVTYDHDGDALNADGSTNASATPLIAGIPAATGFSAKGYQVGDLYGGIENLTGSSHNDTLTGDAGANTLKGGAGIDTLNGGTAGNDILDGGAGNDILNGGDETDPGDGTMFGDTLMGGAGNDRLDGGTGEDTLIGGTGNDDLTGGGGADTYVFTPGNGDDVITTGFTAATGTIAAVSLTDTVDKIDLSAFGLKAGDLVDLISTRAGNTVINLNDYGGGTITIQGVADLDVFDTNTTGGTGSDGDDGEILSLSVRRDLNGDGDFEDTIDGVVEDGIFIL